MTSATSAHVPVPRSRRRASRSRYDAIVIGSGVGGSVSSALLAVRGARVLVLDKNPVLGGILASSQREGFKLDTGSHLVARGRHGALGGVLRQLGLERPRFLTHRIPVRSRGMFDIAAPEHRRELPKYALEAARKLGLGAREIANLGRLLLQVFTLTEHELKAWDRRTLDEFIREHTEHPGLYFLFSFLASIFFVLPPWRVSAGESLRCLRGVISSYSLSYVEGGMDSIPHALLSGVEPRGGELVVEQRVIAIRKRGRELSVTTADGSEHVAPIVVANLAPVDLLELLDPIDVPSEWAARVRAIEGSGNAHQIKLALRRPLIAEGCLIGGVSLSGRTLDELSLELMRQTVASIDVGRVSDPMAIYAPVPSNYDPSLAPDGCQLVIASVYGPICSDPRDPPERWHERILDAFAQIVPGLRDELIFSELTPVPAIGSWMGKSNRGAITNGQLPGQVGADRLSVVTPISGLYIAGDGAGGRGIGTELCASSALEVMAHLERRHAQLRSREEPTLYWTEAA